MANDQGAYPKLGATFTPGGLDDFYMPEVVSPAPQRIMPEMPDNIQNNLAHLELEANPPRHYMVSPMPEQSQHRNGSINSISGALPPNRFSSLEIQNLQRERHTQQVAQQQAQAQADKRHRTPQSQPEQPPQPHYSQPPQYQQQQYRHPQDLAPPPAHVQGHSPRGTSDMRAANGPSYQSFNDGAQARKPPSRDYRDAVPPRSPTTDHPTFSSFPRLRNPPPNVPPSDDEKEATLEQARTPVLTSNDPEMQLAWAQDALAYVEVAMSNESRWSEQQPARPQTPQVEHQLRVDAISIVSFLADQHHPRAEFMKGMWLEFGKFGFRVDKKEAFRCYSRSAEKGYARAEYRMGMQYESSNEHGKAIKHYTQGVALGDSASNYRLGMMTLLGQHGQKQDHARGVHLIRYAAQHADENAPQGAYVYGMLQARELEKMNIPELFLPLDIISARTNIEKAAYLGFAKAQLKMGSAYELCQLGCDFNPALALHYDALASRQGEPEADMAISKWFLCGYDGVFEKNEELAFTYAQRAAQSGLPMAQFAMGYFHEIGMFTTIDLKVAQTWYETAAEHGNKDAVGRIDSISRSKTLSKKDHEDVAIAKIRSQYGSQRGNRPERFRAQGPSLPSISDERVDMPDPSSPKLAQEPHGSYLNTFAGSPPPVRPASVAPYPLEDGPPGTGSLAPIIPGVGMINPMQRPSSAFGIHPDIRPVSVANHPTQAGAPNYRGGSDYYRGASVPPPAARPLDAHGSGRGRGGSPGPFHPPGARVQSLGAGMAGPHPGRAGKGPNQAPYHAQTLNPHQTPHSQAPHLPQYACSPPQPPQLPAVQPPRLEIGFSAPPDPDLEKRHRLHKAQAANPSLAHQAARAQQPRRASANDGRPGAAVQPPSVQASHSEQRRPANHTSKAQQHPQGRSGTFAQASQPPPSRADTQTGAAASKATGHQPPAKGVSPAKLPKTTAPQTPAIPVAVSRPGKGPKTFEEMGVPVAAKESDCVVM